MTTSAERDQGFTLLEVVMAMLIFTVLASFVLGMTLRLGGAARDNDLRVVAAGVLSKQIESVRGLPVNQIPDGTVKSQVTVGNNSFMVEQTSKLVGTNSAVSLCSVSSGSLSYRLVTVTVAWKGMGNIQPARADTLKVVGARDLGDKGTVAVSVEDSAGKPVSGMSVTLTPTNQKATSGADGCAVFLGVPAGTYGAVSAASGYVDPVGASEATASTIAVTSGQVARAQLLYDRAGVIPVTVESAAGFTALASYPIQIRSSYVTAGALPIGCATGRLCLTALPGDVKNAFPGQYNLWMGSCSDAMSSATWANVTVEPGATTAPVTVPLAKVYVVVTRYGVPTSGRTTYVSHPADPAGTPAPSCGAAVRYTITSSALPGKAILLPYGSWTFNSTGTGTVGTTTVTLKPGINTVYVGT